MLAHVTRCVSLFSKPLVAGIRASTRDSPFQGPSGDELASQDRASYQEQQQHKEDQTGDASTFHRSLRRQNTRLLLSGVTME